MRGKDRKDRRKEIYIGRECVCVSERGVAKRREAGKGKERECAFKREKRGT